MIARTIAAAALACAAGAAGAQTPPKPSRDAAVAAPTYRSAFEGYRPYAEETLAPWREVNDTVGRVGGHAGVLRAEDTSPPPQPAAPSTATAAKEPRDDARDRK